MGPLRTATLNFGELRAIVTGYRRGIRTDAEALTRELADTAPDEELLAILSEPFDSVEDTADRLKRTETHLREQADLRSVFLTVYTTMTDTVQSGIESGRFDDPAWVREYLVTFAEYYRRAFLAFERRDFESVPPPWRIAFAESVQGETLVTQDALLGINAHINYDLSYALDEVSIDPNRERKRADHDRINDVLERLTDVVQETLVSVYDAIGVAEIDALLGDFDERISLLGLERSRRFAWRNAVLLADGPSWLAPRYVDWRTRTVSVGAAYVVLGPQFDPEIRTRIREQTDGVSMTRFNEAFERHVPETLLGR